MLRQSLLAFAEASVSVDWRMAEYDRYRLSEWALLVVMESEQERRSLGLAPGS